RFELADGGSLFLDEISEISPEIQVKLLRAIQERQFERVGGIRTLSVDVRLIAATNMDLASEVAEGRFRRDLYYRLNVVPIHLPPLRNRPEDIQPLAAHFIRRMNERLGKSVETLSDTSLDLLIRHHWPGNIRELENVIERAVLLCSGKVLQPGDLNLAPVTSKPEATAADTPSRKLENGITLKEIIQTETDRVEYGLLINALIRTGGNVTRAAQILGLSRKGLQLKLRRHDIDPRNLPERPDFSLT
nr:sigma 54-interacting transcriptional regulator [bacterium]